MTKIGTRWSLRLRSSTRATVQPPGRRSASAAVDYWLRKVESRVRVRISRGRVDHVADARDDERQNRDRHPPFFEKLLHRLPLMWGADLRSGFRPDLLPVSAANQVRTTVNLNGSVRKSLIR